ncbi:hypothetical protein RJ640_029308 [Escallonia rubra]|uniref:Uncharacterized protein n=1 Tax=Escallonia rubra TaxID=112253 RepID=A0AA88RSD6_9ASTE|nr:hypothetical protein RJ640_029308 [Escallonia rubra]
MALRFPRPIAHAIWDPHFGQPAVEAFTRGGALGPVNIAYSGVYQWWYTIGLRTNEDLYTGALFLLFISAISLIAGWLHLQPKWKPSVSWFKNAESRLNHHLSGLFGVSSLAWTGHLVHVAIPGSRGEYVRWNNFLDVLPHPQGLGPLFTGQWNLYAQNPDSSSHLFGTSQGAGTAILTLLGGFHPQTQSLWLTDMAHHHLAIAFIFLIGLSSQKYNALLEENSEPTKCRRVTDDTSGKKSSKGKRSNIATPPKGAIRARHRVCFFNRYKAAKAATKKKKKQSVPLAPSTATFPEVMPIRPQSRRKAAGAAPTTSEAPSSP